MWTRRILLPCLILLLAPCGWARVFVRWTEPSIPSAQKLGTRDLVIAWPGAPEGLLQRARKAGYQVYLEAASADAKAARDAGAKDGIAGVIIKPAGSSPQAFAEAGAPGDPAIPQPRLLLAAPGGKQPQLRGTTVVSRRGFLAVSSPTRQPWIDSNVALIRYERLLRPSQAPLIEYPWELTSPLEHQLGPRTEQYELAIAEAGAFHADLILNLSGHAQEQLAANNAQEWKDWKQITSYIDFYSRHENTGARPVANVGVITADYDTAYEEMNLLARRNIPYRVLKPEALVSGHLSGLALIIVFNPLDSADVKAIENFASRGGTAVLVGQEGSFPWHSQKPVQKNESAAIYDAGSGKVVELATPIVNPDAFAEDIRRLLKPEDRLASFWNSLTVLAGVYRENGAREMTIQLVNYATEPLKVQVRVKGDFTSGRFATPEHGCCTTLTLSHAGGFTQFVAPGLRIGGTVHLEQ